MKRNTDNLSIKLKLFLKETRFLPHCNFLEILFANNNSGIRSLVSKTFGNYSAHLREWMSAR